jgi:hypothetical protein
MEDNMQDNLSQSGIVAAPPPEKPKGKPRRFNCPSCGGTITLKAVGLSVHAVCSSCSSVIDTTDENYRIIEAAHQNTQKTLLDIGTRGRLKGIEWEVIGYTDKTDGLEMYHWDEYLLYNPYYGFRFLVQESGNWNFVKVLRRDVPGAGVSNEIVFEGQKFALFLRGEAVVQYVKGEFYWRVKKGERTFVADYIAPPRIISVEKNNEEINISLGEYIEPGDIASAFAIREKMPDKTVVAPNQPASAQDGYRNMWLVAAAAFALVLTVQFTTMATADNAEVYTNSFIVRPPQKGQTIATASFNIPKESNVLIQTSSQIDNEWLELDLSLIDEKTDKAYDLKQAIEYYHGYDGGEHWSEGSQSAESYLSKVPAGNYRLLVDMDSGAFEKNGGVLLSMAIRRDVPNWSNFLLATASIFIYPLFALFKRWNFEKNRWSESDYTPAIYRINEEED